jgi:hypothetical protein
MKAYLILLLLSTSSLSLALDMKIILIPLYCQGSSFPAIDVGYNMITKLRRQIEDCSSGIATVSASSKVIQAYPIQCSQQDIGICSNQQNWESYIPTDLNKLYPDFKVFFISPQEYIYSCFPGLGVVNGNRAWIRYDTANQVAGYIHELGHMLGLGHANKPNTEYGDLSSVMGFCCDLRCFNPPENYLLNWSKKVQFIHMEKTPMNQLLTYNTSANSTDYIIINNKYYISYRLKSGPDSGLAETYYGRILVHVLNPDKSTTLLGQFGLNEHFSISFQSGSLFLNIVPIRLHDNIAVLQMIKQNYAAYQLKDYRIKHVMLINPIIRPGPIWVVP